MPLSLAYSKTPNEVQRDGHTMTVKRIGRTAFYVVSGVDHPILLNFIGRLGPYRKTEDTAQTQGKPVAVGQELPTKLMLQPYTLTSLLRSFEHVGTSESGRQRELQEALRLIRRFHLSALDWPDDQPELDEVSLLRSAKQHLVDAKTVRRTDSGERLQSPPFIDSISRINPPAYAAKLARVLQILSDQSGLDSRAQIANGRNRLQAFQIEQAVFEQVHTILKLTSRPFNAWRWKECVRAMNKAKIAPFHYAANYAANIGPLTESEIATTDLHRRIHQAYQTELLLYEASNILSVIRHCRRLYSRKSINWHSREPEEARQAMVMFLQHQKSSAIVFDIPQRALHEEVTREMGIMLGLMLDGPMQQPGLIAACRRLDSLLCSRITSGTGRNLRIQTNGRWWLAPAHGPLAGQIQPALAS